MRAWAGAIGFTASAASFLLWTFARFGSGPYGAFGAETVVGVLAVLSIVGIVGALLAGKAPRLSAAFMAIAAIPGLAALAVPGFLLVIAVLMELSTLEPRVTYPVQ
jgi:hypothetical protein